MPHVILRLPVRPPVGTFASSLTRQLPIVELDDVTPRVAALLRNDPTVLGFTPNLKTQLLPPVKTSQPEATETNLTEWAFEAIGLQETSLDGSGVTVAVLDTGVDAEHPYFHDVPILAADFSGEGTGDGNGHGTHCAGNLFGRSAERRVSVAPGVSRALVAKVLDDQGSGTAETLSSGLLWAAEQGAHIASMSLGFDFTALAKWLAEEGLPTSVATSAAISGYVQAMRVFDKLLSFLASEGQERPSMLVLAAAGNESQRSVDHRYTVGVSPTASAETAIAVGAVRPQTNGRFQVAPFSNHGIDVAAPGVDIVGARAGGGITTMTGTSMATPMAAGVGALWAQFLSEQRGKVRHSELRSRIIGSAQIVGIDPADPFADPGAGLVQAPRWS